MEEPLHRTFPTSISGVDYVKRIIALALAVLLALSMMGCEKVVKYQEEYDKFEDEFRDNYDIDKSPANKDIIGR